MAIRWSLQPLHQLFELGLCHIPNVLQQEQVHQIYNAIVLTSVQRICTQSLNAAVQPPTNPWPHANLFLFLIPAVAVPLMTCDGC